MMRSMQTKLLTFALGVIARASLSAAYIHESRLVYQYPEVGTWNENLAVRSNGKIIVTSIGAPLGVHIIDPLAKKPKPSLLHEFPHFNSTTGITEAERDVFYLTTSNTSLENLDAEPHSNNIFRLAFDSAGRATVQHVSHVKDAGLLNGLLALSPTTLLSADSVLGVIWSIDTVTGKSQVAINNTYFAPPSYFPFSVNGLKFRGTDRSKLWFTNTGKSAFGYIPIATDGTAKGDPVQLTTSDKYGRPYDDFVFDVSGKNAYAAVGGGNSIEKITISNKQAIRKTSLFAGNLNSTKIAEPTSAAFGRTAKDCKVLYVATGGGLGIPVIKNGTEYRVGAQIVAIPL